MVGDREIDGLLRGGLEEGFRLAMESQEVLSRRYHDRLVVLLIAALLFGTALLFLLALGPWLALGPGLMPLLLAIVLTTALFLPIALIVRAKHRAKAAVESRWADRLGEALRTADGMTFDLLAEVSREVPRWLSMRRSEVFQRHPFLSTGAFIGGAAVCVLAISALLSSLSSILYLGVLMVPFVAMLAASLWAIAAADRRERDAVLARWQERAERSRLAAEKALEELG